MPTSNLGLVGAGGAMGGITALQDILKRRALEAAQQEQLANQRRAQALAEARAAEDRRQFDVQTGQRDQTFDLERRKFDFETRPQPVKGEFRTNLLGPDGKTPMEGLINPFTNTPIGDLRQVWKEPEKPPPPGSLEQQYQDALKRLDFAEAKRIVDSHKIWAASEPRPPVPVMGVDQDGRLVIVDRSRKTAAPVTMETPGGAPPPPGASVTPGQAVPGAGRGAPPAPSGRAAGAGPGPGPSLGAEVYGRPSDAQLQKFDYYQRMHNALANMDAVEDQLSTKDIALIQTTPLPDLLNHAALSANGKKYAQALLDYGNTKLRPESGAAISADEFRKEAKIAGKELTDTPDVTAQKRRSRRAFEAGLAFQSGSAYVRATGQPYNFAGAGLKTISESDLQDAMKANNWTRQDALDHAAARGYVVR